LAEQQEEGRDAIAVVPSVQQLLPHIPCSYLGGATVSRYGKLLSYWFKMLWFVDFDTCMLAALGNEHIILIWFYGG
jgi:hypothetical protein